MNYICSTSINVVQTYLLGIAFWPLAVNYLRLFFALSLWLDKVNQIRCLKNPVLNTARNL